MDTIQILDYFKGRESEIIGSIRDLVEIESPSLDASASSMAADWVRSEFAKIPLEILIETFTIADIGQHLLIQAFASDNKPVLLIGHTDTVHPIGAKRQNPTRIEAGRFYGCGIFDMKANIVLMIEAFKFFAATGTAPSRPVNILLACDEEVGSRTGRQYVESEAKKAAFCLVCEPSSAGRVKTGRKGTGMFTVRTHGVPAHAGLEPEKGASAILELARQIEILHSMNAPDLGTTVNVCTASGGTTTNVIPEYAECSVDVRFSSMAEAERISMEIEALRPVDERVSITISGGINRPPMERTAAVGGLFEKAKSLAASFGYRLDETQVGGASDGNFVGALGIPVLDGLGISGDGAHTLNEYINVSDIANRATLITALLTEP